MIKGEYDKLDKLAATNLCAEHKARLIVAWDGGADDYVLRCTKDHFPDTLVRIPSTTKEIKQGKHEEAYKASQVAKKHEQIEKGIYKPDAILSFTGEPVKDLGTGKALSQEQIHYLVAYATRYNLDPGRDHVVLMYGKPYITIDGYLYHANRQKVSYTLRTRPLTALERPDYNIPDGDHAWLGEVIMYPGESSFTGLGIVTQDEIKAESENKPGQLRSPVVAKHPQLLAQKRAEWQALRRAFPIGEEVTENVDAED